MATHEIIPAHILIFRGEITNRIVGTMRDDETGGRSGALDRSPSAY